MEPEEEAVASPSSSFPVERERPCDPAGEGGGPACAVTGTVDGACACLEPLRATLTFPDATVGGAQSALEIAASVAAAVASALEVAAERVRVLAVTEGSAIVDFLVLPAAGAAALAPAERARLVAGLRPAGALALELA